ncbi:MAG TPA: sialidase family protein [Thermoplasmata archaeon]
MRYGLIGLMAVAIALSVFSSTVVAGKPSGSASAITFSNTALVLASGSSEPAVTIGPGGTAVFTSLSWITFGTNVWKTSFGGPPGYQGIPDNGIASGQLGGEDADVDIGSTGTLHFTSLVALVNPPFTAARLGVSAITCPNADTSNNFANCKAQIIDTTQADRQWITSDGATVYISYHDSGSSTLIHVQRSDDDGFTWTRVRDPIPGHDGLTGMSTFNNDQGPIVADPTTHSVFVVYAAGQGGLQKGTNANFNNIVVSRSLDKGLTWVPTIVYHAAVNTALNNVFPALAIDPTNGKMYAAWSDAHTVWFAASSDHGSTWSSAVAVNTGPAATAVFPWVAAFGGKVDIVYYGTTASSKDNPTAVWNTYMAQTTDDGSQFTQTAVSAQPNHVGVICTNGTGCARGTRNLLDLFEVAINPLDGKAAIIFTDDTLTRYTRNDGTVAPLPQVVVAWES